MAYYTAVIARRDDGWQIVPGDLDDVEDTDDLTRTVLAATRGAGGLAVIEREDEWIALARVAADAVTGDDARIFVSDLEAAADGRYGALFADVEPAGPGVSGAATAGGPPVSAVGVGDDGDDGDVGDDEGDDHGDDEGDDHGDDDGDDEVGIVAPGAAAYRPGDAVRLTIAPVPGGDLAVLEDDGVDPAELQALVEQAADPAAVLVEVAKRAGFDDLVDAWH